MEDNNRLRTTTINSGMSRLRIIELSKITLEYALGAMHLSKRAYAKMMKELIELQNSNPLLKSKCSTCINRLLRCIDIRQTAPRKRERKARKENPLTEPFSVTAATVLASPVADENVAAPSSPSIFAGYDKKYLNAAYFPENEQLQSVQNDDPIIDDQTQHSQCLVDVVCYGPNQLASDSPDLFASSSAFLKVNESENVATNGQSVRMVESELQPHRSVKDAYVQCSPVASHAIGTDTDDLFYLVRDSPLSELEILWEMTSDRWSIGGMSSMSQLDSCKLDDDANIDQYMSCGGMHDARPDDEQSVISGTPSPLF